jgi:GNAT superfamily N-acetyltransferase
MPDMLVNLLNLPPLAPEIEAMEAQGITIRRPQTFEMSIVAKFVLSHFSQTWTDEITVGYANKPVTIFIATHQGSVIGFGAWECTRRAFFGPTGVDETYRGKGVGRALLLACMHGMKEMGYVYGIIGGAGPVEFYQKAIGAVEIPGSVPGIYTDRLERE